jgi:hypothetical protein
MTDKQHGTEKLESVESLLSHLDEKVTAELTNGNIYEALQYVQSFVARKKKALGQRGTSNAVFHGAQTLLKKSISVASATAVNLPLSAEATTLAATAGGLLRWFIEDGAGPDNQFHLHTDQLNATVYCDLQQLLDLLQSLDLRIAGPVVDAVYLPLHLHLAKIKIKKNSHLFQRINRLETLFSRLLQSNKRWLLAFKALVRLGDAEQLATLLDQWANEGYSTEKPLFFARALMQVLSEGKVSFAKEVLHASLPFVDDNVTPGTHVPGDSISASLAVWHVAVILTELANFPPMPRVDKTKLFGLLHRRYGALLLQVDIKLLELFLKVGETCFRYALENPGASAPSPMAMLQSLFGGGQPPSSSVTNSNKRPAPAGPDLAQLMSMMNKLQGTM